MPGPEKLRLDFQVANAMVDNKVVRSVAAYTNSQKQSRIPNDASAGRAKYYEVEFGIRSWIGRGRFHDRFTIAIDIETLGDEYPSKIPPCRVISTPTLWHPQIGADSGRICTGDMGEQNGTHAAWNLTMGHLILHLAKLINLDEPKPHDRGLNKTAMSYWEEEKKWQPINPELEYPPLPIGILYGPSDKPRVTIREKPAVRIKNIRTGE